MIVPNPRAELNPLLTIGDQLANVARAHLRLDKRRRASVPSRCSRTSRISDPRAARRRVPARALRRHGAARRDRDGADRRAQGPISDDADERPRRDGPGAGARPHAASLLRGAAVGRAHDHPRPRHRRQLLRPRRRPLPRARPRDGRSALVLRDPRQPYSAQLLSAFSYERRARRRARACRTTPRSSRCARSPRATSCGRSAVEPEPVLEVEGLVKHFPIAHSRGRRGGQRRLVEVARGETLASSARAARARPRSPAASATSTPPTADGSSSRAGHLHASAAAVGAAAADPARVPGALRSLNPRRRWRDRGRAARRPEGRAAERRRRVRELLELVHLDRGIADLYPHELSGGRAAAGRHRARDRDQPDAARPRRADVGARPACARARSSSCWASCSGSSSSPTSSSPTTSTRCAMSATGSRDVPRPDRRGGADRGVFEEQRHPYTRAPALVRRSTRDPETRRARFELAGRDPEPDRPAPRLLPRVALPARARRRPRRDPAAHPDRRRADERLHPARARAGRRDRSRGRGGLIGRFRPARRG